MREVGDGDNDYDLVSFVMAIVVYWGFGWCIANASASPPDPWVRMTSPSGCSGGVFHSSRENGVWIATCKHCVNRKGRVSFTFFKDGQRAKVSGEFIRSHPRHDCAIVWVSADNFSELPKAMPIAVAYLGPFKGQAVYAVGSYAGGTVTPAARHVAISSVDRGAYQFRLNDYAWGGHSGGAVVDAETGGMLGVLWGTSGRTSLVTSNRALLETFYGIWDTGQGMYSVNDDIDTQQVARKPDVKVKANRQDLDKIRREIEASHYLNDHFDFDFDHEWFRDTPRIEWKTNRKETWSDGWYGVDGFIWQYRNSGGRFT